MGLYIWKRARGDELFMDYLLVLRNFSLFIVQEQQKKKKDRNLYHTCLLIYKGFTCTAVGKVIWTSLAGFAGRGLESWQAFIPFLGNLK